MSGRLSKKILQAAMRKPVLFLLAISFTALAVGCALHLAGPISIRTHHVEVPDIEIQIGNAATTPGA